MENSNSVTWALSHCVTDDFLSFTNRNSLFFDFVTRNRKEIKKDAANIESLLFNSSRFESSFPRHFERQLFCRIVRDNLEVYQSRRADHGLINLQSVCLASYFSSGFFFSSSELTLFFYYRVILQDIPRFTCCCCSTHNDVSDAMRWFRKSEDNAPRLISLSPLRQLDAAAAAADQEVANIGWRYQDLNPEDYPRINRDISERPVHRRSRSALSDNLAGDRSSYAATEHQHLPCTLKRKPAVRRRSGGKGKYFVLSFICSSATT